ncbi:Hypothetical protein, putative [Bodo saltans]|uniref:Uncharacterized protein n=1 Tax=Bodo saltans TaxID=75058 RepID=A0A0S4J4D9_BODSA|nr:Hypothetical protein, putative [Bodo saltans]|eukprot:CUG16299.1 Hypothetical protein, putative [Bodo saltans]
MPPYQWYTAHDEKLKSSIISLLRRDLLSLPTERDFLPRAPSRPRPQTQPKSRQRRHRSISEGRLGSTLPPLRTPKLSPSNELTELTMTYVGILQRSEDFNRRAMQRDETARRTKMEKVMSELNIFVPLLLTQRRTVIQQEALLRNQSVSEYFDSLGKLEAQERVGLQMARRREGSKPLCHVVPQGKGLMISESGLERSFVELSWRGGVDLQFIAVVLDVRGLVVGVATSGEGVRTKGRLLLLRPLLDYDGNCGNGSGGSHMTFQANLSSCAVNIDKIVFCICPRGGSESLVNLKQAWVTISDMYDGRQRQLFTVACPSFTMNGFLMATSLRRRGDAWQFFNEARSVAGHRRHQTVATLVSEVATQEPNIFISREEEYNRATGRNKECEERERLLRFHFEFVQQLEHVSIMMFIDSVLKRRVLSKVRGKSFHH